MFARQRDVGSPFSKPLESMRFPKLPFSIRLLPPVLAVLFSAVAVLSPVKPGIRIPVHISKHRMGYIDETGRMVLPARWRRASTFGADGFARVTGPGDWSISRVFREFKLGKVITIGSDPGYWSISRSGKLRPLKQPPQIEMTDPRWRPLGPDEQGMMLVWKTDPDGKRPRCHWTLRDGSAAFPGEWDGGLPFASNNLAAVKVDGEWSFINRQGKTVLPAVWDETRGFDASGLACVARNGRWGAIDAAGKLVVPLHFESISGFDTAGMALVRIGGRCGFIDTAGRIVIPPRYVSAEPFHKVAPSDSSDTARVVLSMNQHTVSGWIDRTGKSVVPISSGRLVSTKDPAAPGRVWFVRVPEADDSAKAQPPFVPACYDESGRLIWSGGGWSGRLGTWLDRREAFSLAAGVCWIWWFVSIRCRVKRMRQT